MYLTTNPHADAERYYSAQQEADDNTDALEASAGAAFRSALAWGSDEWLNLHGLRDRTAGEAIAELASTEEGCEAITRALATLAQMDAAAAKGAIHTLSDAWIAHIKQEIESCALQS